MPMHATRSTQQTRPVGRKERRGNILTFFAFLLPVLCAFIMLTVDIGLMAVDKTQLQRTADAAALAAVQDLGGFDVAAAHMNAGNTAVEYVTENSVMSGQAVLFDPANDLEFGQTRLDPETGSVEFVAGAEPANALRVTVRHNLNHSAFANLWGHTDSMITAQAVASKKARDYEIVLDLSCPTTELSNECEVCWDLHDLMIRDCEGCGDTTDKDKDTKDKDTKDKDTKDKDTKDKDTKDKDTKDKDTKDKDTKDKDTKDKDKDTKDKDTKDKDKDTKDKDVKDKDSKDGSDKDSKDVTAITEAYHYVAFRSSYFAMQEDKDSKDGDKDSKDKDTKDKDTKDKDTKDKDTKDKDTKDKDTKDKDTKDKDTKDKDTKDKDTKDKDTKDKDKDKDDDSDDTEDDDCCVCPDPNGSDSDGDKDSKDKDSKDKDKDSKDKDGKDTSDSEQTAIEVALEYTYDGYDYRYLGIYEIGERFLPPTVRIQPLKAIKDAAASGVDVIIASGLDDRLGAIGYSDEINWSEPLTTNYQRIRRRIEGAAPYPGARLDLALQAARTEMGSGNGRGQAEKVIIVVSTGNTDNIGLALIQASATARAGITIHTVGVGPTANRFLLDAIARISGGESYYVDLDEPFYENTMQRILAQVSLERVRNQLLNNGDSGSSSN